MRQLEGKVAIVTGGAAGFGEGIVRLFVEQGGRVIIADLDAGKGEALATQLGAATRFVRCDVAMGRDVVVVVEACVQASGTPDIVVDNAGTTHANPPMLNLDEAGFERMFAVNVKSIFHMAHAVVPPMRQRRRGVILHIGSTAGSRRDRGSPGTTLASAR